VKLVKVRLSGDEPAIEAVLDALAAGIQSGAFEVAKHDVYPNSRDPGYRVYLTLVLPDAAETAEGQRGAAHHRQAIRRPAALAPAKESRGKRHLP
jgi:hypothetical protein